MKGILADNNITKHLRVLTTHLESNEWREVWQSLQLRLLVFRDLELAEDISDASLWSVCQQQELVLLTANRNGDGPDSLEATIRSHNRDDALPVFTIGNSNRILKSREYAERVAQRLIEYLIDVEKYRGTGRLYLP